MNRSAFRGRIRNPAIFIFVSLLGRVQLLKKRKAKVCALHFLPLRVFILEGFHRSEIVVNVVLTFYVHGKHVRSCRDGQLT